jgi:cysteinyl-tRNA synthetase
MLKIYNTLTKTKEVFKPINANSVGMYVCGMTVYDYCHIGHARVMVGFDIIVRHLRYRFDDVNFVRNITDIDDKIIKRAIENGESIDELTTRFIDFMHKDEKSLNVLPPNVEPRATKSIDEMLYLIKQLIDKGFAYQGDNGDIYYSVEKFKDYGKLSGKNLDELEAGTRVEVASDKKNPFDFVLWKSAKPTEPNWESPWGIGRPGWHLECSAMSNHHLGNHFDIHGGGADLSFPHHENEIAQSEGANGCTLANTWMHVGFVNTDNEKMSKSLGNFFTIKDVLKKYDGEVIRYFIISSHYRSPLNYSDENLNSAKSALTRLYIAIRDLKVNDSAMEEVSMRYNFEKDFMAAMDDDFNTPIALSVLFAIAKEIGSTSDYDLKESLATLMRKLGGHIGILQNDDFLTSGVELSESEIEEKIKLRNQAKIDKNYGEADKIRNELSELGVILEDSSTGTTWRKD